MSEEQIFNSLPELQSAVAQPPQIQSMSMRTMTKGPAAPTGPQAPRVPLVEGHAHINETGLPQGETLVEQAGPSDYELAKRIFQERPELIAAGLNVDDVAAEVANVRMELDTRSHKQATDHDKLELQRQKMMEDARVNDARITKMLTPKAPRKVNPPRFAMTGAESKRVDDLELELVNLDKMSGMVASNPPSVGWLKGAESQIRNYLRARDSGDANLIATQATAFNNYVHSTFGATVPAQEMAKAVAAYPTLFDDPKTFVAFVEARRDSVANQRDIILNNANHNYLNSKSGAVYNPNDPTGLGGPKQSQDIIHKDKSKVNRGSSGGDKIDSALKRLGL
jgi:hypothetical protein